MYIYIFYVPKIASNVMDCHAKTRSSNPDRNGVFIELHVLRKGQ